MTPRIAEWLRWYDRSGGRMSVAEIARFPGLLLDVFDAIDELRAQELAWEEAKAKEAHRG